MKKGHEKYNYGLFCLPYGFFESGELNGEYKVFRVPDEEAEFIWDVLGDIAMEKGVSGYLDEDEAEVFAGEQNIKDMLEIAEPYKDKCPTFYEALLYALENDCPLYT